jgi:UDP-N-acetylglucosamine:LPS N-acetylglucosamine transferase
MSVRNNSVKVLAVASAGGHWEQLMQIRDSFGLSANVSFATTDSRLAKMNGIEACHELRDYNQDKPLDVLKGLMETRNLINKLSPDVVISTGAAPGLLCLLWARMSGARTIWLDSIANAERMSLSGQLAKTFSTVVLTQWEHLADGSRVQYWGSVL